jgi:hypothetical protein
MNNIIGSRRCGKQVFYGVNGRIQSHDGKSMAISVEKFIVQIQAR